MFFTYYLKALSSFPIAYFYWTIHIQSTSMLNKNNFTIVIIINDNKAIH